MDNMVSIPVKLKLLWVKMIRWLVQNLVMIKVRQLGTNKQWTFLFSMILTFLPTGSQKT